MNLINTVSFIKKKPFFLHMKNTNIRNTFHNISCEIFKVYFILSMEESKTKKKQWFECKLSVTQNNKKLFVFVNIFKDTLSYIVQYNALSQKHGWVTAVLMYS